MNGFTYDRTVRNSTNLQIATVSFVAGVLASFTGIAGGVIIAAATFYVSVTADKAWWKETYYGKQNVEGYSVTFTEKIQYNYYEGMLLLKYSYQISFFSTTPVNNTSQIVFLNYINKYNLNNHYSTRNYTSYPHYWTVCGRHIRMHNYICN
ncbi:hypothetical protein J416_14091 [Gracilibacillus halophilus YIM-C55.5]|uniref:Uncharacterized protein n=1 Tax=Gracilibacillus halophilus YIM-C55.5 TaxID=1308866 RepID=N4W9C3_9BACI|nr:hypothetical protein J416_14091 [Gracilibacillus halophilus YIM-C55.5]